MLVHDTATLIVIYETGALYRCAAVLYETAMFMLCYTAMWNWYTRLAPYWPDAGIRLALYWYDTGTTLRDPCPERFWCAWSDQSRPLNNALSARTCGAGQRRQGLYPLDIYRFVSPERGVLKKNRCFEWGRRKGHLANDLVNLPHTFADSPGFRCVECLVKY